MKGDKMIYTRFGSFVTINNGNKETGDVCVMRKDGSTLDTHISQLKADGGIEEIMNAIDEVEKQEK